MMPSDHSLYVALYEMSVKLYDCIGMGGVIGPSLYEYKRHRSQELPQGHTLLATYGLPQNRTGWGRLLNAFGLLSPSLGESKQASRQRVAQQRRPSHMSRHQEPEEDTSYPELEGTVTESVQYTYLEDNLVLKTTIRIISIR